MFRSTRLKDIAMAHKNMNWSSILREAKARRKSGKKRILSTLTRQRGLTVREILKIQLELDQEFSEKED